MRSVAADKANAVYDIAVIGGGINGCGIARDAAGRGWSVFLCEKGDLASATSSASTKLIHGGLRYLEYYQFRLVREALMERETLWRIAPHIVWPLRFVLPHHKGLRPAWLLRLGLFLYDHLGGRKLLPPTRTLRLRNDVAGEPLKPEYHAGLRIFRLLGRGFPSGGAERPRRRRSWRRHRPALSLHERRAQGWRLDFDIAGRTQRRDQRRSRRGRWSTPPGHGSATFSPSPCATIRPNPCAW